MKDHEIAEFVNRLTAIAKEHGNKQCVRELISQEVVKSIKKSKTEIMWAINGVHGLYIGTYQTRRDAINDHVRALLGDKCPTISHGWAARKKNGDEAVKVEIKIIK